MNRARIEVPRQAIQKFCAKWGIVEFSLFGSVLREDFGLDSDVDVLVEFSPEVSYSLFDLMHMQEELQAIFGREVDLVEKSAVEHSRNYLRRKAILDTTEIVYAL